MDSKKVPAAPEEALAQQGTEGGPLGKGTTGGTAGPPPSPPPPPQPVVLHVEVTSKRQAQVMHGAVWTLVGLLILLSIVLAIEKGSIQGRADQPRKGRYYLAGLILAAASLVACLAFAATFLLRWWRTRQQNKYWPLRQRMIAVDAAVMLGLMIFISVFWVAPYAAVVGASCYWPGKLVAVFGLIRWTGVTTMLVWMLAMMHGMRVYGRTKWADQPLSPAAAAALAAAGGLAQTLNLPKRSDSARGSNGLGRGPGFSNKAAAAAGPNPPMPSPTSDMAAGGPGVAADGCGAADTLLGQQPQQQGPAPGAAAATTAPSESVQEQQLVRGEEVAVPVKEPGPSSASPQQDHLPAFDRLLVIDLPVGEQLRFHAFKGLLWALLEACCVLQAVRQWKAAQVAIPLSAECGLTEGSCTLGSRDKVSLALCAVLVLLYVCLYLFYEHLALKDHATLPYSHYRITNIYLRVQRRHASALLVSIAFCLLILNFSGISSCWVYLDFQLGAIPAMLSMVIMVLVSCFLYMPASTIGAPLVQAWLQEFSWTQQDLPALRAQRDSELQASLEGAATLEQWLLPTLLPHLLMSREAAGASAAAALAKEPMFCFELAMRLFYWSRLAYQYGSPASPVKEDHALGLFGLGQCECIYEPSTDTKGLVAWGGGGAVVLAFRGTASTRNVLTDVKAIKTYHLPRRRRQGRAVLVHTGFYQAWRGGGFSERVLEAVGRVLEGSQVSEEATTFYITGHSLGGALATLAAFDVHQRWPAARMSVYTFGAPRVGNVTWAHEYNEAVPDTWALINYQDPVPRIPKLLFKRCGQRVTINTTGDIIVRPSYFELSVLLRAGGSVKDHLTGTYALALASVLKAQFAAAKCLPGGAEGVAALASRLDVGDTLLLEGVDLEGLRDPGVLPQPRGLPAAKAKGRRSARLRLRECSCPCFGRGTSKPEAAEREGPGVNPLDSPLNLDAQVEFAAEC